MPRDGHAPQGREPEVAPKHDLRIDATPEAVARAVLRGGAPPKLQELAPAAQPQ